MVMLIGILLALSVKQDHAPLRAGCASDSAVIMELPSGIPLKLRYMMAGESQPCYRVAAEIGNRVVEGYLSAASLDGLESFDQARRQAESFNVNDFGKVLEAMRNTEALRAQPNEKKPTPSGSVLHLLAQANDLIEANQPARALALLEPEIQKNRNASLLAMGGYAAWKADDSRRALEYLSAALELDPNPNLEKLYQRIQSEQKNDQSGEKLYGVHVILRYDPSTVPVDAARKMVTAVDQTYARISEQLGCTSEEKIATIVQRRDDYFRATAAAEWSGGLYDGRIHIPYVPERYTDSQIQQALAHETVHACLMVLGQWPLWLHEGIAQKLSGESHLRVDREEIAKMANSGELPKLEDLTQSWSKLNDEQARAAYSLALAAAEILYNDFGTDGVRNLMRNPERLPAITTELDKRLGLQN